MQLVSWGYPISAYTSSRKKKETDRASCDADNRFAYFAFPTVPAL
jgi:hypothetical protein